MEDVNSVLLDLYKKVAAATRNDPKLEEEFLADFDGALSKHFNLAFPKSGKLSRTEKGFSLSYDGKTFDLGDPKKAAAGELSDFELALVSGGGETDGGCVLHPGQPGYKPSLAPLMPTSHQPTITVTIKPPTIKP